MDQAQFWRANNDRLKLLKAEYDAGRLALFVGAGVSKSCGLPLWRELADRILARWIVDDPDLIKQTGVEAKRACLLAKDPLESMRVVRNSLGDHFIDIVKKCLYQKTPSPSKLISAIAKMEKVMSICTFNYDDVLERAIRRANRHCLARVAGSPLLRHCSQCVVYHPHGYLPQSVADLKLQTSDIVLSDDDYHTLYDALYSWANIVQLDLLLNYTVLLIGCSLTDPNIKRLLDVSRKMRETTHFALMRDPTVGKHDRMGAWRGMVVLPTLEVEDSLYQSRGVQPIWYAEHDDLPAVIERMTANKLAGGDA